MKIGLQLPEVEREVRWPEIVELARVAEEGGFDSLWVGDHLLYRSPARGPWEAWSVLAALAAVTSRVTLGPLVACLGFHNPAVLAKQAATVQEISGGRLVFGVGAGWNRDEFDAFGVPFDHRVERFDEAFTIVRRLLRDGEVSFSGRFHSVQDCVLLPRPASVPPFMLGSMGPRMLALALPFVEIHHAWFAWFSNTVDGLRELQGRVDEACGLVGRDPATLQRSVALYVQLPGGGGRQTPHEESRDITPIPLDALGDVLGAVEATGVTEVQLVLDPITVESVAATAEVIAR
ncbi:MAG: LLM class flavin-dependent oxidoreductase [Actinobacteria bacterium]|nr:LLM class flavin-dependent oxidoreductase [Actinomycetota bacterium]MBV9253005.1 LLM class flavin-dependent oxidoreductase [Actinomycetota bacterium]